MTTLAILGGGIVGRSLLYNLTCEQNPFDQILFFESDSFAFPCSIHSTAIVAKRGVTSGHSTLGDQILKGFECFSEHVQKDSPHGIFPIKQYTSAETNLEQFKKRYPDGENISVIEGISLSEKYFAKEEAYLIDPALYLNWLIEKAKQKLPLKRVPEFVTSIEKGEKVKIKTQAGHEFEADRVIFATGSSSRYWKNLLPSSKLETAKAVQGAYLEFSQVGWKQNSFSITWEGQNLIYHAHTDKLLIGSTTHEWSHSLPQVSELLSFYEFFKGSLNIPLPDFEQGKKLVGHREKASKREPYIISDGNISFIGGMYKNGYTLSLEMTKNFFHRHPLRV